MEAAGVVLRVSERTGEDAGAVDGVRELRAR
jgi:hypothetical protein